MRTTAASDFWLIFDFFNPSYFFTRIIGIYTVVIIIIMPNNNYNNEEKFVNRAGIVERREGTS